jgi:cell division protein FtsI (penicillin-binding protein 3)
MPNKLYKISQDSNKNNKRIAWVRKLVILIILAIICKLFFLQIWDIDGLKKKASIRRQSRVLNQAMRGDIVDRNGSVLVSSKCYYDVYIDPRQVRDSADEVSQKLSIVLGIPKDIILKKIDDEKRTVILAKNVDMSTNKKLRKLGLRCLDIIQKPGRDYPQGKLAAHILGYVNPDAGIYAGVESTAQRALEDMPEFKVIETSASGEIIYDLKTDPNRALNPIKGKKITLTLDTVVQHIAEVELRKGVEKYNADRGCVVVMNPKNGEILAFALAPGYEPFNYRKYDQKIVKNWALTDVYPPGSTFKVLTIASALETGVINENITVMDTGKIKIQGYEIKNYDYSKHPFPGIIDLYYLFEHSSNVGSLKVGLMMSDNQFYSMLRKFNLGQKTGIDLPGESSGILPKPPWQKVRQATVSFGYSLAATPIQMASAVASIANGGVWITPHIIKYPEEELPLHVKTKQTLQPETAKKLTQILEHSIRNSKADVGKIPNFTVAGKTGTSNKPKSNGLGYTKEMYTSFVGFFPSTNPEVLIMVVIDNPKGGNIWGSTVAGPIFNEIAAQMIRIRNMKPDAPGLHVKGTAQ